MTLPQSPPQPYHLLPLPSSQIAASSTHRLSPMASTNPDTSHDVDWELLDSSPSHLHPKGPDYFVLESHGVGSDGSRDVEDWPSDDSEHGGDGIVSEAVQEVEPEVVVVESNDEGRVEEDDAGEGGEEVESDVVGSDECSFVEESVDLEGSDDGGGSMEGERSVVGTNGGGGEGEKRAVWWRMPIDLIKFYAFRVSPVWSISIAAAVVGIVALARRLRSSNPKARLIPLKIRVEDKFEVQTKRLTGAFSLMKRVAIYKVMISPSKPGNLRPWPVMDTR